jgi:cell division protein ZapA
MADVRLNIASREYIVTCRDGEESHLHLLAASVDEMIQEAGGTAGGLNESRQLLFASLLLADKLHEANAKAASAASLQSNGQNSDVIQQAVIMEKLADRIEAIADKLES